MKTNHATDFSTKISTVSQDLNNLEEAANHDYESMLDYKSNSKEIRDNIQRLKSIMKGRSTAAAQGGF